MILEEQSRNSLKFGKKNIMDDFGEGSEDEESSWNMLFKMSC